VATSDCPDFLELPGFLELPRRTRKPRAGGITHVLDKGLTVAGTEALVAQAAGLMDIVKIGWGIGYVDPTLPQRVRRYVSAGIGVCLGGTLVEIAASQRRIPELRDWAARIGVTHLEVSNGLCLLTRDEKRALIRMLCKDFVLLAETGAKTGPQPESPAAWAEEMSDDLAAGASWVVAEGRESGTVGLYASDQAVHEEVVAGILGAIPQDRVLFEAPAKAQQSWFVATLGANVNLGNIATSDILPLETLRLGLRADTAVLGAPA
jgi:phosphosulfolactate synthase